MRQNRASFRKSSQANWRDTPLFGTLGECNISYYFYGIIVCSLSSALSILEWGINHRTYIRIISTKDW